MAKTAETAFPARSVPRRAAPCRFPPMRLRLGRRSGTAAAPPFAAVREGEAVNVSRMTGR
jgi:hypothetical protein